MSETIAIITITDDGKAVIKAPTLSRDLATIISALEELQRNPSAIENLIAQLRSHDVKPGL